MRSLDLNRAFYHDCVAPILRAHCPEIAERHAAALIGWGSEVLGNDDELSKIYGWGPRLLLLLTPEEHRRSAEDLLSILQEHTPAEFMGHPTRYTDAGPPYPTHDPAGNLGITISTCERFIRLYLGLDDTDAPATPLTSTDWLLLTEASLLRLTAGEVYHDGIGSLTELREYFRYFPDDVWRYRLAYQWTVLGWDIDLIGLCAHRDDILSARLATARSVERIMGLAFLLNKAYKPGYLKWYHRQFYKLPYLAGEIGPQLERALSSSDSAEVPELFYPILDSLVAFQSECAGLPVPDYKSSAELDRGFFAYDLAPVVDAVRESITGELRELSFHIGALDQWIVDQDLLMGPGQLRSLRHMHDCEDPHKVLFERTRLERGL